MMMEKLAVESTEVASIPCIMTEEEFEAWCDEDVRAEYIDEEVIVHTPASTCTPTAFAGATHLKAEYNANLPVADEMASYLRLAGKCVAPFPTFPAPICGCSTE